MTNLTPGQAVSIGLAALALAVVWLASRWPALARRRTAIVVALALAAVPAHLDFLRREHLHTNEFFHYYVGTKYFAEVGYSGLYEAAVVADAQDDPAHHTPSQGVRSLTTYAIEPRQVALDRADAIKGRFTPARWAAFKEDVAWFRAADGILWTLGDTLRDHGYNGTPLVTAILGGVARQPFLTPARFIPVAAWFDLALVLLAAACVARWIGLETGAWFLFAWAANPLNDYGYIGGAYLRTLHLVALALALCAFAKRRFAWSGAGFAVAILLRVFPAFLVAGLAGQALLARDRARRIREQAPLYLAAAATAVALVAVTAVLPWAGGAGAWRECASKLALHGGRISPNVVGLADLFFYDEATNVAAVRQAHEQGRSIDWSAEASARLAARAVARGVVLAIALALLALWLRRGAPEDGLFAGLALVWLLLHLAHYDYAVLALVPLLFAARDAGNPGDRVLAALCVLFVAAGCVRLLPGAIASLDARFHDLSALIGIFLAVTMMIRWRAAPAAAPPPAPRRRG